MALIICIGLVQVLFEVAKPLPVKVVIDNVLTGNKLAPAVSNFFSGFFDPSNKKSLLVFCSLGIALLAIGGAFISIWVNRLTVGLAQELVFQFSMDFYAKLQRMSLSFYQKHRVGDLIQRMSGDVFVVYFLVAQVIIPIVTAGILISVMFLVMASIDPVLALVALGIVPLLAISLLSFMKPMNAATTNQHKMMGRFSAFLNQSLSSMKIVQAFAREDYMKSKVENYAREFGAAYKHNTFTNQAYIQVNNMITGVATAVLIGLGAYRGLNGNFTAGELYIFIGYTAGMFGPVSALFSAIGAMVAIRARGKRVYDILESDEEVKDMPEARTLTNSNGDVIFEGVWFGYDKEKQAAQAILKNISFTAKAGQITALVGPTGAGKTSLISLLARFYEPWNGRITLDGQDLKHIKHRSLRQQMSIVLQEPFLFPISLRDNIAFGNPDATEEEIIQAAKMAQAHDFIMKLPQGYDTNLSEAGSSISGGERQRISLARAFIKKTAILILDEPTSALDALTESRIFTSLAENRAGRTIFIISHRLSTIRNADQILAINNGEVVETGTHEELFARNGFYTDLYKYQHLA